MCCASREPAQNFEQYIDTSSGTGTYIPITLDEHWNSDHMKSVRRRMMAGEVPYLNVKSVMINYLTQTFTVVILTQCLAISI
jgi:hypothetical protein